MPDFCILSTFGNPFPFSDHKILLHLPTLKKMRTSSVLVVLSEVLKHTGTVVDPDTLSSRSYKRV